MVIGELEQQPKVEQRKATKKSGGRGKKTCPPGYKLVNGVCVKIDPRGFQGPKKQLAVGESAAEFGIGRKDPKTGLIKPFEKGEVSAQTFKEAREQLDIIAAGGRRAGDFVTPRELRRTEAIKGLADPLISDIQEGVDNLPSLAPTPLSGAVSEGAAVLGEEATQTGIQFGALLGPTAAALNKPEFAKTKIGKAIGAVGLAGLATASIGAGGFIIKSGVSKLAGASVAKSTGALSKSTLAIITSVGTGVGISVPFVTKQVLGEGELDTHLDIMDELSQQSQTLRGSVEKGTDPQDALRNIRTMLDELEASEARVRELGARNLAWRFSKEYLAIEKKNRDTRLNLLENANGIRNLALQGQTNLDPEQLMLLAEQFK